MLVEREKTCAACEGSGEMYHICNSCSGTSIGLSGPVEQSRCYIRKGRGEHTWECEECDGRGVVYAEEEVEDNQ